MWTPALHPVATIVLAGWILAFRLPCRVSVRRAVHASPGIKKSPLPLFPANTLTGRSKPKTRNLKSVRREIQFPKILASIVRTGEEAEVAGVCQSPAVAILSSKRLVRTELLLNCYNAKIKLLLWIFLVQRQLSNICLSFAIRLSRRVQSPSILELE